MIKICHINLGLYGSTGTIMYNISELAKRKGMESYAIYPELDINFESSNDKDVIISGRINRKLNHFLEKITGFQNCFSFIKTFQVIKKIGNNKPDIIHLHNLHSINLNYGILFKYIKKNNIPIVWTLHDCWSFTGQCPHFSLVKCDKWKTGCYNCPQYTQYPSARVDRTKKMWKLKRRWFTGVKNMTIVTPSNWLADLVNESFLREYPVRVINNGIDLSVFKHVESDFIAKHNIMNKYIVLGVAMPWSYKKGIDIFIELSKQLDNDRYQIVLVGTNDEDDQYLPDNIISIHRTNNQQELVDIYSAANIFVNPTREENFPTVNIEALACGIPIVTFRTGGSPEIIDKKCGLVVDIDDIESMKASITQACEKHMFNQEACVRRAKKFDVTEKINEYITLYIECVNKGTVNEI